jgi:hypothetical protein
MTETRDRIQDAVRNAQGLLAGIEGGHEFFVVGRFADNLTHLFALPLDRHILEVPIGAGAA